jgi:hypothetical protein
MLPAEDAASLRAMVERIHRRYRQQCEDIIATGLELIEAKGKLRHGKFKQWLRDEFAWTDRTARRYMTVAQVFGRKTDIVSVLPAQTLYRLAAPTTPQEVRDELLARVEAGERITREVVLETLRRPGRAATGAGGRGGGKRSLDVPICWPRGWGTKLRWFRISPGRNGRPSARPWQIVGRKLEGGT